VTRANPTHGSVFRRRTRIDWDRSSNREAEIKYGHDWFDDEELRDDRITLKCEAGNWQRFRQEDDYNGWGPLQPESLEKFDHELIRELETTGEIKGDKEKG